MKNLLARRRTSDRERLIFADGPEITLWISSGSERELDEARRKAEEARARAEVDAKATAAHEAARADGDVTLMSYTSNHLVTIGLGAGEPLDQVEAQIAAAEANRARWAGIVTRMQAAGRPCRWEEGMLGVATEKLERLRRSRAVLAGGGQDTP